MRKRIQVVIIALCAVIMLSLIAYLILHLVHGASGNYPEAIYIENASQIYDAAVINTKEYSDLDLQIKDIHHITAQDHVYSKEVEQFITYKDMYSPQMTASVEEIQTIGSHSVNAFEIYSDNTIYLDIESSCFRAPSDADTFRNRYAPAIPLNAELYGEITGLDTGSSYIIVFKSPTKAESWIGKDTVNLAETWAVAYVSHSGELEKSVYYVSYSENGVTTRRAITVALEYSASTFDIPEDTLEYTPISYIDGPKELEIVCGYLLSAKNISAQTNDTIFFEAYGDKRLQQINIQATMENGLTARVDTNRTLENASHTGEISTYKQTQTFENNTYSISENGSDFKEDETVTLDHMRSYYQNLLVSTIMLPQYISDANESIDSGIKTITFSIDSVFANQMITNACQTLYQKPDLMDTLESSHRLTKLTAYIQINAVTGVPQASGILYSGTHNINNFDYLLEYTIDQTYKIPG